MCVMYSQIQSSMCVYGSQRSTSRALVSTIFFGDAQVLSEPDARLVDCNPVSNPPYSCLGVGITGVCDQAWLLPCAQGFKIRFSCLSSKHSPSDSFPQPLLLFLRLSQVAQAGFNFARTLDLLNSGIYGYVPPCPTPNKKFGGLGP